MSRWSHAVCGECWFLLANAENWGIPVVLGVDTFRVPIRVKGSGLEPCCFCTNDTVLGIYVREDPAKVDCDHD